MTLGVDGKASHLLFGFPGQRVKTGELLYLISKKLNPHCETFGLSRKNIYDITAHPKIAPSQLDVIAGVLQLCKAAQDLTLIAKTALTQMQDHPMIGRWVAQPIDRRNRGNNDDVFTLQDGLGSGQAHLINMFVNRRIFFNEGIACRNIGFRLVIIIIRNKILNRITWKELPHLCIKLGSQSFVWS